MTRASLVALLAIACSDGGGPTLPPPPPPPLSVTASVIRLEGLFEGSFYRGCRVTWRARANYPDTVLSYQVGRGEHSPTPPYIGDVRAQGTFSDTIRVVFDIDTEGTYVTPTTIGWHVSRGGVELEGDHERIHQSHQYDPYCSFSELP